MLHHRITSVTAGLLVCSAPALADVTFPDFSSTSGLVFNGSAGQNGNVLRLTPNSNSQEGSAWFNTRQNVVDPWICEFEFQMGNGGADGMAFVIQRDGVAAIGGGGGELGYDGILNSVALELDVYGNGGSSDPTANHISVHTNGSGANTVSHFNSLGATSLVPLLNDGAVHTIRLEYAPGSLAVILDGGIPDLIVPLDIDAELSLNDGTAWVGFTGATGGISQNHDVRSWSFDEATSVATGNLMPEPPPINEPAVNGQVVNPFDVHMEAFPFSDPNLSQHLCTDWEIWRTLPLERVWRSACISGPEAVHAHLGDGIFEGTHTGQNELDENTAFTLRVRMRDDSGDPLTEWGPWAERTFLTADATTFLAFETEDLVTDPAPAWTFAASGFDVVLASAPTQPRIVLESQPGGLLLEIAGNDGITNTVTNPGELPAHVDVRVRIESGSNGLVLGETDLVVVTHECDRTRILLPALNMAPNSTELFWITSDGGTWFAGAGQTTPIFNNLARGATIPWVATQPGYRIEVVASGLQMPVNLAFVPNPGSNPDDPFLYVTELYGRIQVVRNDGTMSIYADNLLNYAPTGNFPGSGEQGLSGIDVDPNTGDVYAGMLYDAGGPHYPKVVRFTSLDGGLTAATQTTILDMNGESQGQSHFISNIELQDDGTLMVHMGDGFTSSTAQNLGSFRGKILRMNLDGSAPASNPLYNGAPITARDYVWSYGVRNPFGGATRASDGFHYSVENGPSVDRLARMEAGVNYGWNGSDASMGNQAIHNWAPSTGPVNIAWIQPTIFSGSGFPASKQDHAFVTESGPTYATGPQANGKRITEFEISAAGNLISGPTTLIEYAGTGKATVAGLAAGPDGLYFTDLYADQGNFAIASGAQILRVRYVGADLGGCGAIGASYCQPASNNSTSQPALLTARGSEQVADNDVTLDVVQLPPNQFGFMISGPTQAATPLFSGVLCLSGTIGRHDDFIVNSGASGVASLVLDLDDVPTAMPPFTRVMLPGDTWNFQFWYRDFVGGTTANFSDGVEIAFQ